MSDNDVIIAKDKEKNKKTTNKQLSQNTQTATINEKQNFKASDSNSIFIDAQNKLKSSQQISSPIAGSVAQHWQKARKPRFEIELYEEITDDVTGEIKGYKKVPSDQPIIIEAANKKDLDELAERYQFCHQRMKIVRKIDDGNIVSQNTQQTSYSPIVSIQQNQMIQQSMDSTIDNTKQQQQKPKFYKIGDVEIKDDNGKIYQKQWMKLTDSEANNFRLVSDKNNAIVNMNGKHLEMKKWVLVQYSSEDESTQLEENMK